MIKVLTSDGKRAADALRLTHGLPPIYVDTPRALTQDERRGRRDVKVQLPDGTRRHYVPMVRDGWVVYVDVLEAAR